MQLSRKLTTCSHLLSWNFWQAPYGMKMPPQYPEEEQNVYLTADLHIDQ